MCVRLQLACALAVAGCSDDASVSAHDAAAGLHALPAEVDAVLEQRCRTCHGDPPEIAPFPLVTWEDTQAPHPSASGKRIYEVMAERINDPSFPMPPEGNPFTQADRDTLNAWLHAGAGPGEPL